MLCAGPRLVVLPLKALDHLHAHEAPFAALEPSGMLPSHYRSSGGTDADAAATRRAGALLEARKKYGNKNNPQPLGLILLTASCCLVLLFQVC